MKDTALLHRARTVALKVSFTLLLGFTIAWCLGLLPDSPRLLVVAAAIGVGWTGERSYGREL